MFPLALMALLTLACPAHAQSWQWAMRPTGTAGTSMLRGLATDAQGNVYVAGKMDGGTATFGSITLTNASGRGGFVGKLSPAGQWLWAVAVPDAGYPVFFNAAVADGAGNVYLTGSVYTATTFGSTVLAGGGGGGAFVAKLNAQGQWQWATAATSAGAGTSGGGFGLALDPATGDPVMVGATKGNWTYGAATLANPNNNDDAVVARLAAGTGQWLWARSISTTGEDQLPGVAFDGAGAVYVIGQAQGPLTLGSLPPMPGTSLDVVVAKLSGNGQTWLWATRFGAAGNDHGVAVVPLASGEVAVVGDYRGSYSLGGTQLPAMGDRDIFVARLDAGGQVVTGSARFAGGPGRDDLISVVGDRNGNLLLSGMYDAPATFGPTTYPPVTAGASTAFVARYLANGTWSWVTTAGGPASVSGWVLTMDPTGTYVYHGGQAAQSVQFGALSALTAAAGSSGTLYVARMGVVLATRPAALGGQTVRLWPNPATGTCAVQVPALPGATVVAATLLDGLGRAVRPFTLPAGATTALDLAGLPAGFYVLRLAAGAETTALRLAVE